MNLEDISPIDWIISNNIKNEQGLSLDFEKHLFLFDVYVDMSPKLVCMKAAQVGFSTTAILKSLYIAKKMGMDIIYTLPTQSDVVDFVSGKVNRIIAQNPIIQSYVRDKDSVEQKRVGDNVIYYRGTWTDKAALMVSSDLNIYDEEDRSKQPVIQQYASRLQHSKYQWEWHFSNPSSEGNGVSRYWRLSDQKHWFIRCSKCTKEQFLSWPESIDQEKKVYICKFCKRELSDDDRAVGRWVKKYNNREYSGYLINLLMVPLAKAEKILDLYKTKSEEYFYNFVLGLPHIGSGNKLTQTLFMQNLTNDGYVPNTDERVVIGVDTGVKLDYVVGNRKGIFYHGEATKYDDLDDLMNRWPKAIAVVDMGGDLIGSRAFQARHRGRVFLCALTADRKTQEMIHWGKGDENGACRADRNRLIQLVVDEFREGRIPVHGTENDWYEYWLDWDNLSRIKVVDSETGEFKGFKWVRNGRDHRALATVFWRIGMDRFGAQDGKVFGHESFYNELPWSPEVMPDGTIESDDPKKIFDFGNKKDDWRNY
jgi:hypothetical protein